MQISVIIEPKLAESLTNEAENLGVSRSRMAAICIERYFGPTVTGDVERLQERLENEQNMGRIAQDRLRECQEREGWLRDQYQRCNDRLVQYQLPPPRRSFWDWLRRKQPQE